MLGVSLQTAWASRPRTCRSTWPSCASGALLRWASSARESTVASARLASDATGSSAKALNRRPRVRWSYTECAKLCQSGAASIRAQGRGGSCEIYVGRKRKTGTLSMRTASSWMCQEPRLVFGSQRLLNRCSIGADRLLASREGMLRKTQFFVHQILASRASKAGWI